MFGETGYWEKLETMSKSIVVKPVSTANKSYNHKA